MSDLRDADRAVRLAGLPPVSRETAGRLVRFVELLHEWSRVKNLVGPSTLAEVWERHIADSAQLLAVAPAARSWLDLGSGAGFPGIVVAILLAETVGAGVHLVESNQRKGAFLRTAADETGAPAVVHTARIEDFVAELPEHFDAISARALAPLSDLSGMLAGLVGPTTRAYLHKGTDLAAEKIAADSRWSLDLIEHSSRIGSGTIVEVRSILPK